MTILDRVRQRAERKARELRLRAHGPGGTDMGWIRHAEAWEACARLCAASPEEARNG